MTYTERFDKLVNTWERAYMVILPTKNALKKRLHELDTWDNKIDKIELEAKEKALQNLIKKLENKPQ